MLILKKHSILSKENPCGKKQKQRYECQTDKQCLGNTKGCRILCEGRGTAAFCTPERHKGAMQLQFHAFLTSALHDTAGLFKRQPLYPPENSIN
jgi:hypothetical protein